MFKRENYKYFIIYSVDFLIIIFSLWLARFFGNLPRWWYLLYASICILSIGIISKKLKFDFYKRIRYALLSITLIDIFSVSFTTLLYIVVVADFSFDHSVFIATLLIILLESCYYWTYRKLVLRKKPFLFEPDNNANYSENGSKEGAKIDKNNVPQDVNDILEVVAQQSVKAYYAWIKTHQATFDPTTQVVNSCEPESLQEIKTSPRFLISLKSLNKIKQLDDFLSASNLCLEQNGYLMVHCTTAALRKEKIMKAYPKGINTIVFSLDYLWHRVFSKLLLTQWFYFGMTNGKFRVFPRVEVLGRICRAGFEIKNEDFGLGEFYVVAQKIQPPLMPINKYGLLIRLKRIGKDGKWVGIYKFRTMYAYSEYLQSYVYQYNKLQKGGKFSNDYRVNLWGKLLRKTWFDELPMLLNLLRGDIKLVGVRPLSPHYFSLYSPELQALRIKTKPGLLPPFYVDMPQTLEEIEDSEKRYLNAYLKSPFQTDWKYFWAIMKNIVIKRKRSA